MNDWNDLKADYPTRLEPTDDDLNHICATFDEWFVTLYQTERIIFAFWNEQIFFSYGFGRSWRYYSDNEVINPRKFLDPFTYLDRLTELNPHKGTALFNGKAVKWNRKGKYWAYNNNYVVDFHNTRIKTLSPLLTRQPTHHRNLVGPCKPQVFYYQTDLNTPPSKMVPLP